MSDDLERILAFRRALELRLCTRTEAFAYGTAYFNADFPHVWDGNFLWAELPLEDVTADALVSEAERVLGGAGSAHREVFTFDDHAGERLAPRFVELGWKPDHSVTMVLRRNTDRPATAPVRELGFQEARLSHRRGDRPLAELFAGRREGRAGQVPRVARGAHRRALLRRRG